MTLASRVSAKKAQRRKRQRLGHGAEELALRVAALAEDALLRIPAEEALLGAIGGVLNVALGVMTREEIVIWLHMAAESMNDQVKEKEHK